MGRTNDSIISSDVEQSIQNVKSAAKNSIEDAITRTSTRLRSDTKTRKSAATRERIMSAATDLMVERGNTDFQMSEVSARCKMSKGAIYYYFADKSALVDAIFDRSVDDLVDKVESTVAKAKSSIESLFEVSHILAHAMRPGSALTLAMTYELVNFDKMVLPNADTHLAKIVSIFTAQLDRAKGEGIIREDVDSRLSATALAGGLTLVVLDYGSTENNFESDEFVDKVMGALFGGIGTEKGNAALAERVASHS